ncbi:MAG: hypothetical protein N2517_07685 [Ignavibacteria bacterium]|nr:hypothetical protein [Ignavibacteria bacterium]
MAIDKSFIESLPSNPLLAETKIIGEFNRILENANKDFTREAFYEDFLNIFSFYQVYAAKHSLNINFPPLTNDKKINTGIIINFFENRQKETQIELEDFLSFQKLIEKKSTFESLLREEITYKLSDKDLNTLYHKFDSIIDLVNENFDIKRNLKLRLIGYIGTLKKELKPEMSNFDKFWSLVSYIGLLYGLYGDKVIKIIDRIKDVLNFIWKVQATAEGLPITNPVITIIFKEIKPT